MSAFYTFLSSLYNCLLKFISLIILLGEVRKFLAKVMKISGGVQSHHPGGAHLPPKSGLAGRRMRLYLMKNVSYSFCKGCCNWHTV